MKQIDWRMQMENMEQKSCAYYFIEKVWLIYKEWYRINLNLKNPVKRLNLSL